MVGTAKPTTRHRAFNDSDDEGDAQQRREEIVSFGRDGARRRQASPTREAGPLVIPVASNLDWRQDRKQRLGMAQNLQSLGPLVSMRRADSSAVPGSSIASTNKESDTDAINTEEQESGLRLRERRAHNDAPMDEDSATQPMQEDSALASQAKSEEQGTDQEALKALLAGGEGGGASIPDIPLVITQEAETELLQHDIDTRPEAPTLDDYAATPIDQFGMALLRGMGWKEGMGAGKNGKGPQQAPEPKKRAALLGLGAKERPSASAGLSSSSSSRGPRPTGRKDYKYVPVLQSAGQSSSNGRSHPFHHDSRSARDERRDKDVRHSSSRDESRHSSSRPSHRQRSRSPTWNREDDRDRHRDRRRDERDSERRSHTSSRSDRDRRHDRERDDRRREHRR